MSASIYYKAVQLDGTDFYTGTTLHEPGKIIDVGRVARKRPAMCCTDAVVHAGLTPTDVWSGTRWPVRLFEVAGRPVASEGRKRGFRRYRVVREVGAHLAFGPQGEHVAALIERARVLTEGEVGRLHAAGTAAGDAAWAAAWDAARTAAWDAAWAAAWDAARTAAWAAAWAAAGDAARTAAGDAAWAAARDAAGDAAGAAAWALATRDLIGTHGYTQSHHDTLVGPWASVIGPVHPEDGGDQ